MLNNDSVLWNKKYENSREYKNLDDFFKFARINPTVITIKPHINDQMKVLEVGSGTGELISYLQHTHPKIKTYGLDYSSVSILKAQENCKKFKIPVSFTQASIKEMPYEDEYFDIVFGDQVLAHLDNVEDALKEIYRITKTGGIVAFTSANKLRPDGWYLYKKLSRTHEGYRQESYYPWELSRILNKNGFKKEKYYGEVLILFRNVKLINNFLFKQNYIEKNIDLKNKSLSVKKESIMKKIYNIVDGFSPPFLKITIGVLAKK